MIEYSDNYSDTSGSLSHFSRDEEPKENNGDLSDLSEDDSSCFKYKSNLISVLLNGGRKNGVKLEVPLKYLSNFWKSLEISLIDCKIELSLRWYKNYILSTVDNDSTVTINDAKLYVSIVTLSIEDNAKLSKILSEWFKRSVYWNEYKVISKKNNDANEYIREQISSSIQGIRKLFVLAYGKKNKDATENSQRKYFLPRIKTENYNIEIDGTNFYD